MAPSLLLVDDHPLWRETVTSVLHHREVAAVVGEAADGAAAVAMAASLRPELVLMDMQLPGVHGLEATRRICEAVDGPKVLVLSSSDDPNLVLAAIKAGASGYLLKTAGAQEIAEAVSRVAQGELVLPPTLTRVVLAELRGTGARSQTDPLSTLSARELDVLKLMAQGSSNVAIGRQLFMSPKTVEAHISSVFGKLGLEPAEDVHRRVLAVTTYLRARRDIPGEP